jgi:hypothetical protein
MRTFAKAAVVGLGLVTSTVTAAHAQYNNYYGAPYSYYSSPYNYPGYQYGPANSYYYYPGYGYTYNYPTPNYYNWQSYRAPTAYWDPYVAARPYSDNAGPKAGPHGSP